MVKLGDEGGKLPPQQIAYKGHQGLKAAEIESGDEAVLGPCPLHREPLADGDGKGVHRQPDGNDKKFPQIHLFSSSRGGIGIKKTHGTASPPYLGRLCDPVSLVF